MWTPPAEVAIKALLSDCYNRALLTRMHAQQSISAMFVSIDRCRAAVQLQIPKIHRNELKQTALDLLATLDAIGSHNPANKAIQTVLDQGEISRLKLSAFGTSVSWQRLRVIRTPYRRRAALLRRRTFRRRTLKLRHLPKIWLVSTRLSRKRALLLQRSSPFLFYEQVVPVQISRPETGHQPEAGLGRKHLFADPDRSAAAGHFETSVAPAFRSNCGHSLVLCTLSPEAEDAATLKSLWSQLTQIQCTWSPRNCPGGRRSLQGSCLHPLHFSVC